MEGQIGLEATYQEFIKKLIDVFTEAKRVLKKEGTCFVNLGDSYSNTKVGNTNQIVPKKLNEMTFRKQKQKDIPEKSLMLIPHRFAIAMIDNGWILRNTLVWVKPNAMPESVQDRWKKAHEYIFFFTKNKNYYFNLDAIRTKYKEVSLKRAEYEQGRNAMGLNPSSMGVKYKGSQRYYGMPARMVKLNPLGGIPSDFFFVNINCAEDDIVSDHYATYPKQLIIPLIKSGCPEKGIVMDPFNGSGTTCVVAKHLGRNYLGIELNPEYIKIAENRLKQDVLF